MNFNDNNNEEDEIDENDEKKEKKENEKIFDNDMIMETINNEENLNNIVKEDENN